jgi:tRNA dimethylallyltransferase
MAIVTLALKPAMSEIADRVARRVEAQFARGIADEVRGLLARGVPEDAQPFKGLVYRQVLEWLHGVRDEAATRALIVRENLRYARRQLIWFRKEPNLVWFQGTGDEPSTRAAVEEAIAARAQETFR